MNSSVRSRSVAVGHADGLSIAAIGAVLGASLGVVLAALLDVSAPLAFDGGMTASWTRGWLIGALVGAGTGYVLGALIAWDLSDDAPQVMPVHGDEHDADADPGLLGMAAAQPSEFSESRRESSHHP